MSQNMKNRSMSKITENLQKARELSIQTELDMLKDIQSHYKPYLSDKTEADE